LGGFHHYDPQKGEYIFDFLPLSFIAVTVSRVAEKHFELLFSAGNSDTVHIRPSKIPYIWATYFEALFGSPGLVLLITTSLVPITITININRLFYNDLYS